MEVNPALFDHKEICLMLYSGNVSGAELWYTERMKKWEDSIDMRQLHLYVSSMNLAIYYFILAKEDVALQECCSNNIETLSKTAHIYQELLPAGISVIRSYGYCQDYLIEKHKNEHIRKCLVYINKNLTNAISLSHIAKHVSLSKEYLSHLFKKEMKVSLNCYICMVRIRASKNLLKFTQLNLDHLCGLCGFNSTTYFCTVFREFEGISPQKYRKQCVLLNETVKS